MKFVPLILTLVLLPLAWAHAAEPLAEVTLQVDGLLLHPTVEAAGYTLTVSLPDGTVHRTTFEADARPSFLLGDRQGPVQEGSYTYQLIATPRVPEGDLPLRALQQTVAPLPSQTGYFRVLEGGVILPTSVDEATPPVPEGRGGLQALPMADRVFNDDVIVVGNLCAGEGGCVNGENFGENVVRVKDDEPRIDFMDTSGGNFPGNDWRILINSTSSGGGNFFAIEDSTSGADLILTLEAGAPVNTLYIDDQGRVGLGTATPVADFQITSGDTPALRLEQDTSQGPSGRIWEVGADDTLFYIQDVTSGSALPFQIEDGAPDDSLVIDDDGNIGIGTASPDVDFKIVRSNVSVFDVQFEIETDIGPAFDLTDTGTGVGWRVVNHLGSLRFADVGTGSDGAEEFVLSQAGNMSIEGDYFSATCTDSTDPCAPDYVFEPDYPLLSLDEVRTFIAENKHLPNVPSAEELTGPVNVSKLQFTLLEKIEELMLYTLAQEDTIRRLQERVQQLEEPSLTKP